MDQLVFDDIKLFMRIVALGTLSGVARERNVPVSQVSRALSRIEKTSGARLIHRSTHGLALTSEGEVFLDYGRRLAGTLEELEGEFASKASSVSGRVRVAASTVIAEHQLLPSLEGLHRRHPALRVDLEVGDALADLARDAIDIAIRTATALPETQIARRIGILARALYAAPAYAAREGLPTRPDELGQHHLVTNSAVPHLNDWQFEVEGKTVLLHVDGHWRANDTGVAASMILQGLGIGRLATIVGEPLVQQGRLVPVLPGCVAMQAVPVYAVTASARQRLPKIRACIDYWAEWFDRRGA